MMSTLLDNVLKLFSSEAFDHTTSILSNLVTIGVVLGGYFLAQNWLEKRNNESAHAAADRFFDELINLPSVMWNFIMDSGRCAAFMTTISNDEQFQQYKAEVMQRLLLLSEKSLAIKLNFFGCFAYAERRGVNVCQERHTAIEHSLNAICNTSCSRFNAIVAQVVKANAYEDYSQAMKKMNIFLDELYRLAAAVNEAVRPVINVSFSDYFSFPGSSTLSGDRH